MATKNKIDGRYNATEHGAFIRELISEENNWGKYTRSQVAEMASEKCGYKVTTENVRSILRGQDAQGFTTHQMPKNQYTGRSDRVDQEADRLGVGKGNWSSAWIKEDNVSMYVRNDMPQQKIEDLVAESIDAMQKHKVTYPKIKRTKVTDPHLLVIDPADVHIGKLALSVETGEDYNIEIAKKRCIEGVEGLIQKSQGFPIERVMLVIGNDILHFDTPKRTTTSGTPQDTDGQLHQIYLEGLNLYVQLIERLMQVADVEVVYNPSNHDYMSGYMLAQTLAAWFRQSKNVSFDVSIRHRKYTKYGENLIATSHGDGAKHADMPMLMAAEADDWSSTKFRYIYLHHLHHKKVTKWQAAGDLPGVTLQILRSPSATDGWHDRKGYACQPKAVEGFIHHKTSGQVASLTHYF